MTANQQMTTAQAIAYFDSLEIVPASMMIGSWYGKGIDTDHKMDGMLEASKWHGKVFEDENSVYPLVHTGPLGGKFFVNPALLPLGLTMSLPGRDKLIPILFPLFRPILSTRKPHARLRMMEFRGKVTATMCYDDKPINDVFRKIDDNTVMGWMDRKGMDPPYFFTLIKEQ